MGYYDAVLKAIPFTSYQINSAETGYTNISGRTGTFTGALTGARSIMAGVSKSIAVIGTNSYNITTSVFTKGSERKSFTLVAWFSPLTFPSGTLSILSHSGVYDGLMFDGDYIKFRIKSSLNNWLEAKWPVPDQAEAYMVAGVYNTEKIQLIINDEVVSEADVTDEFKTWAQEPSSNLYLGQASTTSYKAVGDGLSTFAYALNPTQLQEMFSEGREVINTIDAVGAYGGSYWTGTNRKIALQREWEGDEWLNGLFTNSEAIDGDLRPQNDFATGLSMAGTWRSTLELSATEDTSIGGVRLDWDGDGSFVVQTSIDNGGVWNTATNGRLVINTFGLDTTGKILDIRVTFTGGLANDIAVVRRLRATVFEDAVVTEADSSRTLTLTDQMSTGLEFNEPIERNMSSGFDFYNGKIAVSADATTTPRNIATMEFWIRPRSAAISGFGGYVFDTRPAGGTAYLWLQASTNSFMWAGASAVYINGVLTSSGTFVLRYGEWIHVVFVLTTPFNTTFEIGDDFLDANIGLFAFYPTALTAANATALYDSYTKVPVASVADPGIITVAEPATPVNMYAYDWESQNV